MIVQKSATFTAEGYPTGSYALLCGDRVLAPSVSSRYRQLERPLDLFATVAERIGIPLHSYGISDRNSIWGRFTIEEDRRHAAVGEVFRYSLSLVERPLRGFLARTHVERLRCRNGATTRFGAAILSLRHVGDSLDDRIQLSIAAFDRVRDEIAEHGLLVEKLRSRNVEDSAAVDIFTLAARPSLGSLTAAREYRQDRIRHGLDHLLPRTVRYLDAYYSGDGAEPGSAWGVYNALNYRRPFNADASEEKRDLAMLAHLVPELAALS